MKRKGKNIRFAVKQRIIQEVQQDYHHSIASCPHGNKETYLVNFSGEFSRKKTSSAITATVLQLWNEAECANISQFFRAGI